MNKQAAIALADSLVQQQIQIFGGAQAIFVIKEENHYSVVDYDRLQRMRKRCIEIEVEYVAYPS